MKRPHKDVIHATVAGGAGAGAGAGAYALIGGVGLTALGTGIGITLAPFIAIGAGVSLAGFGLYRLGRQIESINSSAIKLPVQIVVNTAEEIEAPAEVD